MALFHSIQDRLIGKALKQCSDPFEEGKVIVMFNFSIVMLLLTLPYLIISIEQFIGNFISGLVQVALLLFVIIWLNSGFRMSLAKHAFLAMFVILHLYFFTLSNGVLSLQGVLFMVLLTLFSLFLYGRTMGWIMFAFILIFIAVGLYNTNTEYSLFYVPGELGETEPKGYEQFVIVLPMLMIAYLVSEFVVAQKKAQTRISAQNEDLLVKNKEIHDSINYAKRIQSAILPPQRLIKQKLPNAFILYKPKDIVAGDFYWLETNKDQIFIAAADCTGHGVPGAMVSVICNGSLNRSLNEFGLSQPGPILDKTRELVIQEFEKSEEDVKDGMDIALCSLEGFNLKFAGANNPLWIIRNKTNEVEEIKGDKQPIGKYADHKPFISHSIKLNPGDTFYTFSDGFSDQFGGDKGKKFKAKNFKSLLLSVQNESMDRQKELIDEVFEKWKGNLEQLDDVCVIGVRV